MILFRPVETGRQAGYCQQTHLSIYFVLFILYTNLCVGFDEYNRQFLCECYRFGFSGHAFCLQKYTSFDHSHRYFIGSAHGFDAMKMKSVKNPLKFAERTSEPRSLNERRGQIGYTGGKVENDEFSASNRVYGIQKKKIC